MGRCIRERRLPFVRRRPNRNLSRVCGAPRPGGTRYAVQPSDRGQRQGQCSNSYPRDSRAAQDADLTGRRELAQAALAFSVRGLNAWSAPLGYNVPPQEITAARDQYAHRDRRPRIRRSARGCPGAVRLGKPASGAADTTAIVAFQRLTF
jgi:hypothetical protein